MNQYKLLEQDEFPHEPSSEQNYNESVYVNSFDLATKAGGWMRIGNRANERHAEMQVCMYLPDGRIACQFQKPAIDDNSEIRAGGLYYQVTKPLHHVTMEYSGEIMLLDDPDLLRDPKKLFTTAPRGIAKISYDMTGISPVHGGEPLSSSQQTMYGRDFSLGHFNQHMKVATSIDIDNVKIKFAGLGWRDHSWGPRYWTNIYFYRLFIANFGDGRAMMLLKLTDNDGNVRVGGVLQYDGEYEEITDMDVTTQWTKAKDPAAVTISVQTKRRSAILKGEILTLAPLRNRRKVDDQYLESRVAEGLTHWQWGDKETLGITEYIELVEDGQPVGYPL